MCKHIQFGWAQVASKCGKFTFALLNIKVEIFSHIIWYTFHFVSILIAKDFFCCYKNELFLIEKFFKTHLDSTRYDFSFSWLIYFYINLREICLLIINCSVQTPYVLLFYFNLNNGCSLRSVWMWMRIYNWNRRKKSSDLAHGNFYNISFKINLVKGEQK